MISLESTCKCFQYGEIILLLKGEFRDLIGGGIRVLWTYQSSVFECNKLQSLARSWDAKFSSWCQSLYNNNYDVCWEYQWELNLQNSKTRRLELTAKGSKKSAILFLLVGLAAITSFLNSKIALHVLLSPTNNALTISALLVFSWKITIHTKVITIMNWI